MTDPNLTSQTDLSTLNQRQAQRAQAVEAAIQRLDLALEPMIDKLFELLEGKSKSIRRQAARTLRSYITDLHKKLDLGKRA